MGRRAVVSSYSDGVRVEHAVIDHLRANGYDTVRAASSKGLADVVAVKPGQILFVNCKRTTPPGPAEREALLRVAAHLPTIALPIVALKPLRKPLQYRVLLGVAPKAWAVWTPDEAADGGAA
jgi:Holliday junction resolvase